MAKGDKEAKRGARGTEPLGRLEHWKTEPDDHDYPAARDYLSLLLGEAEAGRVVQRLRQASVTHRKAKDLLRASRLPLLRAANVHVAGDLRKIRRGERLSPVLLVRGSLAGDVALTIADGYHRICASYHVDEDADIPCRLVGPPASRPSQMADAARPTRAGTASTGDAGAGATAVPETSVVPETSAVPGAS